MSKKKVEVEVDGITSFMNGVDVSTGNTRAYEIYKKLYENAVAGKTRALMYLIEKFENNSNCLIKRY